MTHQADLRTEIRIEHEGAVAYRNDVPIAKNPYAKGTLKAVYWQDGHNRCRMKNRQR